MQKELEKLGFQFEREGGSHTIFKHPNGASFALNKGLTKDPKALLKAAKREINKHVDVSGLTIEDWQGSATLCVLTGADFSDVSKSAKDNVPKSGYQFEKRKTTKEEKAKLGIPLRSQFVWRAFKANDAQPILPEPETETETWGYELGTWAPAKTIATHYGIKEARIARAFERNWKLHKCLVERSSVEDLPKAQQLGFHPLTKWAYRLTYVGDAPKAKAKPKTLATKKTGGAGKTGRQNFKEPKAKLDKSREDTETYALELLEENENLKARLAKAIKAVPKPLQDRPLWDVITQLDSEGLALRKQLDEVHRRHEADVLRLEASVEEWRRERNALEDELDAALALIPENIRDNQDLQGAVKAVVEALQSRKATPTILVRAPDPIHEAAVDVILASLDEELVSTSVFALALALFGRTP
jgi:hypothetical protein